MLNVKVDRRDPTDLYEQVAGEIRRAIARPRRPEHLQFGAELHQVARRRQPPDRLEAELGPARLGRVDRPELAVAGGMAVLERALDLGCAAGEGDAVGGDADDAPETELSGLLRDVDHVRSVARSRVVTSARAGCRFRFTLVPSASSRHWAWTIGRANPRRHRGQPALHPHRKHTLRCRRLPGSHLLGQNKGGFAHPSTTIGRANLNGSAVNNQFMTGHPRHIRRPRHRVIRAYSDGVGDLLVFCPECAEREFGDEVDPESSG
ncbi:MAG TPA: hypothetical protein VHH57_00820 [Gaiella sp.]|jgi:hypothetical protein|nr:hypothetical protein [Gaiella sp.]